MGDGTAAKSVKIGIDEIWVCNTRLRIVRVEGMLARVEFDGPDHVRVVRGKRERLDFSGKSNPNNSTAQ